VDLSVLESTGALRALARLLEADGGPIDAMAFAEATGAATKTAKVIREKFQMLGIIEAKLVVDRGAVQELEIRLTPLGRELAEHALAMEEALRRAGEKRVRR
jgi:hypothetical protein